MSKECNEYLAEIERNIEKIPLEYRERIYHSCAVNCVKAYVLPEQKAQFDDCNGDMDLIYEKYPKSDAYFRKIIKKGKIYEMGYPRCLCSLVGKGACESKGHCECSRQSILYILHELMPDRKIKVETIETVLGGADQCRFRIYLD